MPAVIFDLDDTLYPHVQFVHSGFAAVAAYIDRHFGVPAPDVYAALRFSREFGHHGTEFQRLCAVHDLDEAVVPDLLRVFRAHTPQLWLSYDAGAVLTTLRASGWRTAVLTNGLPSTQAAKVHALALDTLVDHVVYANQHAPQGKPAAAPFVEVLRRMDVAPQEAVMVGDDPETDIEGARAVGLHAVLISRAGSPFPRGADAVIRLLTEVPKVASELVSLKVAHAA